MEIPSPLTKQPEAFAVLATIAFGYVTFMTKTEDSSTWNYILSSISQGLAALLAIVLTVSFVITQIFRSPSGIRASKPLLIPTSTMFLLFLYSLGILIPLIVIQSPNEMKVDACIVLAAFCIFSLIPYLYSVGRETRMKPSDPKIYVPKVHFKD